MKRHVTKPGAMGGMDAKVVDTREKGTRTPGGFTASRIDGHEHADEGEIDPL